MSNNEFSGATIGGTGSDMSNSAQKLAGEAFSKVSEAVGDATEKARQSASSAVGTIGDQFKELLDRQVESGAEMVGHLANAANSAADDLDQNSPAVAKVVRGFAGRIDGFADDLRDQTADQLFHTASDFTRRQPALVFGLAALAGFFVFRTLKSAPSTIESPSIQPEEGGRRRTSTSHAS
jgi:hypothetical protein